MYESVGRGATGIQENGMLLGKVTGVVCCEIEVHLLRTIGTILLCTVEFTNGAVQ